MFLFLLRGAMKMPGDEQTKKVENHACLVGHYRNYRRISRTTTQRGINKMPKCLSCPGDCKELSISEAHTTQTKPGPSHGRPDRRPPTTTRRSRSG